MLAPDPMIHLPDPARQPQFYDGVTIKRGLAWVVDTETEVALVDAHLGTLGWRAVWRGFTRHQEAIAWLLSTNGGDRPLSSRRAPV